MKPEAEVVGPGGTAQEHEEYHEEQGQEERHCGREHSHHPRCLHTHTLRSLLSEPSEVQHDHASSHKSRCLMANMNMLTTIEYGA